MHFPTPLLRGELISRYKRFFADVRLDDGRIVTAHCPNTGAMTGCAEAGFTVYLSESSNPKRKLKYTWELAQNRAGNWICVNTMNANKVIGDALHNQSIAELADIADIQAELKPEGLDSRFDFAFTRNGQQGFIEVKSVTLLAEHQGWFPDAKTARGIKHCQQLQLLAEQGVSVYLLFCAQHTGISSVSPARHIDPQYANALQQAQAHGVIIRAYGCAIDKQKIEINQQLTLHL